MMFQFFPGNYVWNTATSMALAMGGLVIEIDEACRPLQDASRRNDGAAQEEWFQSWGRLGERIEGLARADEASNPLAAGRKYLRACAYHMMAERMLPPFDPRRAPRYRRMLDCFARGAALRREPVTAVDIPYGSASLPALLVAAEGKGPSPCLVHLDGFDGMKEMLYLMGLPQELRRRGVATLIVDHPGVGEALRLRGMPVEPLTEKPAGAALDWLASSAPAIDPDRVGVLGISLGGYYAPRAAAFDPRFKCCVAWGASWDYGRLAHERVHNLRQIERSVSHWPQHFRWVFGTATPEEALPIAAVMTLEGVIDRLSCPFLIVHGENDRQTALADAVRVYDAATGTQDKELRVFTLGEGGAEHCNIDNMTVAADHIAEWVARKLGAVTPP
jgi:dienelactone hydrolase